MSDSSFLSQLEQRTQQVKITLANLEAERARIEALISRLEPLVPQYDALVSAERQITDAAIELHTASSERPPQSPSFNGWDEPASETRQQTQQQQPWS